MSLFDRLRDLFGPERVHGSPLKREVYSSDSSSCTGVPDVIFLPRSAEEVAGAVRLAAECGVPVVPRGAGTCLSGGPVPALGGLVLSLARMDRVKDLDPGRRRVTVEAGVVNGDLQKLLEPHGLWFPPDPASYTVSTIGGNIAENAGGPRCVKYGVTGDHVAAVEVVTASGERLWLGEGDALDLRGLMIGSEGTLGIITGAVLRVRPLPEARRVLLAAFDSLEAAGEASSALLLSGIGPSALEIMDGSVVRRLKKGFAALPATGAALMVEVDGGEEECERRMVWVRRLAERHGAVFLQSSRTPAEAEALWRVRRGGLSDDPPRPNALNADIAIPPGRVPEFMAALRRIGARLGVPVEALGHIGDGNLHPQVFFGEGERDRAERALEDIYRLAVDLGGTISGEHGIGLEKLRLMPLVFNPGEISFLRRLKRTIDPVDILNPGKVVPPREDGEGAFESAPPGKGGGVSRGSLVVPSSAGEVREVFLQAAREGFKCRLAGRARGDPGDGVIVASSGFDRIIDFSPRDFTVTVEAGVEARDLDDLLREEGMRLPGLLGQLDGTIGGLVATGAGRVRDHVLDLTFITGGGERIRAGVRTVKNVAGYDLTRLLTGSRGALGFIESATLRLVPLPPENHPISQVFPGIREALDALEGLAAAGAELFFEEGLGGPVTLTAGAMLPSGRCPGTSGPRLEAWRALRVEAEDLPELFAELSRPATFFPGEGTLVVHGEEGGEDRRVPGGSSLEGALRRLFDPRGVLETGG